MLVWLWLTAFAYTASAEDFSKRAPGLPLSSECKAEQAARERLPSKRGECRHAWALAQEFRQNFPDLTALCQRMDKAIAARGKVAAAERKVVVKRMRALLNPPSFGQVVHGALLERECEEEMAVVHDYRNRALEALTPLVKKLDSAAKDYDPDDFKRSRFSW